MEKEGISLREELQSISNNARKNITLSDEEYDEKDGSMIWLSALIEDKLKKFATQGHHEMRINLFDFFRKIDSDIRPFSSSNRPSFEGRHQKEFFEYRNVLTLAAHVGIIKKVNLVFKKNDEKTFDDYVKLANLIKSLDSTHAVQLKHYLMKKYGTLLLDCNIGVFKTKFTKDLTYVDYTVPDINMVLTFVW
ncbi:hypothetical protein U2F58_03370 [Lactobacillus johnsonii]|uniref:hypothetical protein n=1 Tax=Lactobacillus johnsonii TaxID=33959 RepID=UPI00398BBC85